jgi:retron-type reverse transcriptase
VSAVTASPTMLDSVRALQHTLYRAAKADPGRRFHALYDKVFRRDVMWRAWVNVRRNDGAPGIDKTTLDMVEEYGVTRLLDELVTDLRNGSWRPLPARRVFIPKPGTTERRPLSIPTDVANRPFAQAVFGFAAGDVSVPPVGRPISGDLVLEAAWRWSRVRLRGR